MTQKCAKLIEKDNTPPNFTVDWNGRYRIEDQYIYFSNDNWKARSWITECKTYFTQPSVHPGIPDDPTKVFFCLIKMTGKADFWKCVKLEEYTKEGGAWPAWAAFKTAFIEAFGGDDPKMKALTKLMTME
ncbi:hypothetical protein M378DRAFT_15918 [Amanita muscaria Koide BX008]|uniref:Uncharacterized protein n=1 Tax=Amanita muscaria (strain Koide BX008) TaxID=946122 RepID=A0A0C2WNW1_AMAMK|nr:hypothetical protein M378DRAFT_15918 [Amanita muscaria Koide BX008]